MGWIMISDFVGIAILLQTDNMVKDVNSFEQNIMPSNVFVCAFYVRFGSRLQMDLALYWHWQVGFFHSFSETFKSNNTKIEGFRRW